MPSLLYYCHQHIRCRFYTRVRPNQTAIAPYRLACIHVDIILQYLNWSLIPANRAAHVITYIDHRYPNQPPFAFGHHHLAKCGIVTVPPASVTATRGMSNGVRVCSPAGGHKDMHATNCQSTVRNTDRLPQSIRGSGANTHASRSHEHHPALPTRWVQSMEAFQRVSTHERARIGRFDPIRGPQLAMAGTPLTPRASI